MKLINELVKLEEGMMDNHRGDLERKFDDTENKLITVRRMLGKLNGLSKSMSPEDMKMHKSKVMRYINHYRKQLYDLMFEMGMSEKEMNYHKNRIDLDRAEGKPAEVFTHNRPAQ